MTATVTDLNARTIIRSAVCQQIIRERDEAQETATRYRAALVEISRRHHQAEHGWCANCAMSWPCPDRQATDEALHPGGNQ